MNIIILGGNFSNKGARTMLAITSSRLRTRFPDAKIYYCSAENSRPNLEKEYGIIYLDKFPFLNSFGNGNGLSLPKRCKYFLIDCVRKVKSHRKIQFANDYQSIIKETKFIFDISGFALSSKFGHMGYIATDYYLDFIEIAHKRNIPVFLMPQSFGPFDYGKKTKSKMKRICEVLPYAKVVFAREKSGYDLLTQKCGLRNVILSKDLVLQEKAMSSDLEKVQNEYLNSVAVIPNIRLLKYIDETDFLHMYKVVVDKILSFGKKVYLFPFADEDCALCEKIKGLFDDSMISVLMSKLEISECEKLMKAFDYTVASRYHSIVHGYRLGTPCVCIGWADKYVELLEGVGQANYLVDVAKLDLDELLDKIENMQNNSVEESQVIKNKVKEIQENNCFDVVFEMLESEN